MADLKTGTTRWQATKQWAKWPTVSRGSTAVLVAAFIAAYGDIRNIIQAGKAGKPMGLWDFVDVVFVMAFAAAHNFATYTDDTHAREKDEEATRQRTESEWLKSNIPPPKKSEQPADTEANGGNLR